MADTHFQMQVEEYIRSQVLKDMFGIRFRKECRRLKPGGVFEFDAVSEDDKIVVCISTSSGITAGGKHPSGKIQKLRADMLFLLMAEAEKRLMILTEQDMFTFFKGEKLRGRIPDEIEFVYIPLPEILANELIKAKLIASMEVRPGQIE